MEIGPFRFAHDSSQDTSGNASAVPGPMSSAGSIRTHNGDLDCDRGGPDLSSGSASSAVSILGRGLRLVVVCIGHGAQALVRRVGFVLCPGVDADVH